MRCGHCQTQNRQGAQFCSNCGSAFALKCARCGHTAPSRARFCDFCGHPFSENDDGYTSPYPPLSTHTPKELADKILTARKTVEGERKLVSVLFIDVAGYTAMSELLDPEEVHRMMNQWFKILLDHIHTYEGIVTQFLGDGVMALFGVPIAHEDHAQRACHAALAIQKAMKNFSAVALADYRVKFAVRTGVNSGWVVVGSIGDDLRMEYAALGDTINLASRIQTMALPGSIVVSKHTYVLARDFFKFKPMGKVVVKGKAKPLETYVLVAASGAETRFAAAVARGGLTRFVGRNREISSLEKGFEETKSGTGRIISIVGEAGLGKSANPGSSRRPGVLR